MRVIRAKVLKQLFQAVCVTASVAILSGVAFAGGSGPPPGAPKGTMLVGTVAGAEPYSGEVIVINPTLTELCAAVFATNTDGDVVYCYSKPVQPLGNAHFHVGEWLYDYAASVFVIASTNLVNCGYPPNIAMPGTNPLLANSIYEYDSTAGTGFYSAPVTTTIINYLEWACPDPTLDPSNSP